MSSYEGHFKLNEKPPAPSPCGKCTSVCMLVALHCRLTCSCIKLGYNLVIYYHVSRP